jgi:two-component system sensor histidine kinase BaeS
MKGIYRWLLQTYVTILLIFIAVQAALLMAGLRIAIDLYNRQSAASLEETARAILINPDDPDIPALDYANPFFVFRADRTLAYTNRGQGRSLDDHLMRPVLLDGNVIGYWYAAQTEFQDRRENQLFLLAVIVMAASSLVVSGILASVAAGMSATNLSRTMAQITGDIAAIDGKTPVPARSIPILELNEISRTAAEISVRLVEEETYKRQWMQDLAHDLRTPIAGVKSQLEAMRDGILEADAERMSRNLAEIEKLEAMVADINALSALENRQETARDECPPQRIAADLRERFDRRFASAGRPLRIDGDGHQAITADYQLLLRALSNLLENALAYGAPDSEAAMTLSSDEAGTMTIRMLNAPAAPPEGDISRWFQRFHRGEFARRSPGTGLGLNIAREVFRRHGGDLDARVLDDGWIEFSGHIPRGRAD